MEPIISPWTIYLLCIIGNVIGLFTGAVILCGVGIVVAYFNNMIDERDDSDIYLRGAKRIKKFFIFGIIIAIIGTLIPTKETIIAMYVAKVTTPDNVGMVYDKGLELKEAMKEDIKDALEYLSEWENSETEVKVEQDIGSGVSN